MKKAKDYAKQYQQDPSRDTLESIIKEFWAEVDEIAKTRHARSNQAYFAILDEQDRKWKAFARRVGDVKEEGFEYIVEECAPDVYAIWRGRGLRDMSPAGRSLVTLAMLGSMWRDKAK